MELYGENIISDVTLDMRFSKGRTKYRLETSQRSNKPTKFDLFYNVFLVSFINTFRGTDSINFIKKTIKY